MRWFGIIGLLTLAGGSFALAAELKPATVQVFEKYIRQTEQRLDSRKNFLWADESSDRMQRILHGDVVVEPTGAKPLIDIGDGLIHDWVGAVFVRGISLQQTLDRVRDYNSDRNRHHDVLDSRIVEHHDNEFLVYMRLLKKKIVTVVLDTEHQIQYIPVDETRWKSRSHTVKIAEVQDPGKPSEKELPPGTGSGYLWKLNTYWRFEERNGGTWIECQAVSLTRDIPTGLGWLIEPIIRSLPKESLENTLRETANGLLKR